MGLGLQTSVKWPIWIATSTADLGILTGVTVLLAWALNISALKSVFPGSSPMAPGTAVGFALAGIALRARSARPSVTGGRLLRIISRVAAAILAVMGALRLGQYLTGMNLHLDLLFFPQSTPGAGIAQMSEITCFAFVLLGAALLLVDAPCSIAFHVAVFLGGLSGWVGLSRYLFGGKPVLPFKLMAFHTSINFLLLNAGVLCLRTDCGLMAVLTSRGSGGHIARRLVPATLLLVPLAGWILLEGQRASLYGTETGVSLFSLSTILLLGGLIWFNTARLDRAETADGAVRESLRQNRELMRAVVESSDDAIISKTLSGMITTWNSGAAKLFGYAADEAVGKSVLMLFPPNRINEQNEILRKIARAESIDHLETVHVRKDGAPIEVSVTLSPIRDMSGAIIGASEIARDITARNHKARKVQTQLSRLDLLSRITRAIGERLDLNSIYQVVIRSVEDQLPVDFACICTYDGIDKVFSVTSVGVKSEGVWGEMPRADQIRIPIDQTCLPRSLAGELVYEPDLSKITSPFTDRLARAGLRSVVIAPLSVESEVFGVLVVARREPESFGSAECEFLSVLSAHTAVAAHQAQLYGALQRAYEDLRHTQQGVMQQERLRALGEMATGVAHDINNGLSPILLYTSLLLEREKNLSDTAREYLEDRSPCRFRYCRNNKPSPRVLSPARGATGARTRPAQFARAPGH